MKIRSHIFTLLLSLILVTVVTTSTVFAVTLDKKEDINFEEKQKIELLKTNTALSSENYAGVAKYAYMNLESSSAEVQELILKAREELIWSVSWTAEPGLAWVERASGEVETIPAFYSIFPSDWDIPTDEAETISEKSELTYY